MTAATADDMRDLDRADDRADRTARPAAKGPRKDDLPLSMAGRHNPWLIAVIVSIATFMEVLDVSIANVSLTHIAGNLSVSFDQSTWVLTSYLVSNAIVLPISGWLSTVFGRKPFYMACVAIFTVSSFACGLAPSLGWLVFFRVLQGLGGGGLAPSEQAILHDTFPQRKWGAVFALYGVVLVVAPAIGPTLGGWITDNYSWHWVFLINVPVGIVSMVLTWLFVTEPPAESKDRAKRWKRGFKVDYIGFGLVALGLGLLQIVLDKGEREDWFDSTFILSFTVIAVVALVLLIVRELTLKDEDPIVNLPLLKNRGFAASNFLMFWIGFILFGTTQLLPQLVQTVFDYTSTDAGLVITPGGIFVMCLMPLVGFMINRVQPRYMIGFGLFVEGLSLWYLSGLNTDAAYFDIMLGRVFQAGGLAFLIVPITTVAYIGVPADKSNDAAALLNLSRNLGGSFGISLAQTWLARRQQFHQARLVEHANALNPNYLHAVDRATSAMRATGASAVEASRAAPGMIYGAIQRQSAMLSYLDVFHLLMWAAFLLMPLIFLLRKMPRNEESHGGH